MENVPGRPSLNPSSQEIPFDIEAFYDGECPICVREVGMLRKLDQRDRIRFTDITAADFSAKELGVDFDELMARMHGRLPDGTIVSGVQVFRRMYAAVGWTWPVAVSRWPGIKQLLNVGYRVFARNRLRLSGRCDKNGCAVERENKSKHNEQQYSCHSEGA